MARAKQDFDLLIEEARTSNRRFVVEVKGKPMAVILGIEEWGKFLRPWRS
ncbi:MAG: type II toxin-antitoxin system prevent-host-death family antitoxin [Dehalococcoidia bacterium]|nr:type II toxin-antitoxin system prevent-host-death family antitoxin [Dehalococcoidia bacterium]